MAGESETLSILAPAAFGLGQFILGLAQRKKAKNMYPEAVSPEMAMAKDEFNRKRKNLEVGSAYSSQMRNIKELLGTGINKIARSGNISGANYFMKTVGNIMNQQLAEQGNQASQYDTAWSNIISKMNEQKLKSQEFQYSEQSAKSAMNQKAGFDSLLGGLMRKPTSTSPSGSNPDSPNVPDSSFQNWDLGVGGNFKKGGFYPNFPTL